MSSIEKTGSRLARLKEAVRSGASVTDEDVTFLSSCLGYEHKMHQRAAAECFADLVRRDPRWAAALDRSLESSDLRVRWGAAYAVALLGRYPPAVIDTALELLGSEDRDLRWAAADLIKRAVVDGQLLAMRRLCESAKQGSVVQRRMALYALREVAVNEPAAVAAAQEGLAEQDVDLRLAALAALVGLSKGSPAVVDRVIPLLEDQEPRVQRAAAAALGSLGSRSPDVIRAIRRALTCSDESVRRAAKGSLARLGVE